MLLDPHLSYNNHIIKTVSSCMSRLRQINRVKHVLDRRTLLIVMNTLVFSKLFYCSNVWANCSKLNIDKLQSVQNFACRIVSGIQKYDHVTPELKRLRYMVHTTSDKQNSRTFQTHKTIFQGPRFI